MSEFPFYHEIIDANGHRVVVCEDGDGTLRIKTTTGLTVALSVDLAGELSRALLQWAGHKIAQRRRLTGVKRVGGG